MNFKIESLKDYIKIHTTNDKQIISKYKIGEIEVELADKSFLRALDNCVEKNAKTFYLYKAIK